MSSDLSITKPPRYAARKPKRTAATSLAAPEEATICPRLFLSQHASINNSIEITAAEVRNLRQEAVDTKSEPGMLMHFEANEAASTDWVLIPFDLFERLLAATQPKPA